MNVQTLEQKEFKEFCKHARRTARWAAEQRVVSREVARAEAQFIARMDIGGFRTRALFFAARDEDGCLATVVGVRAGKRPVGDWGRYLNVYYLYTVLGRRGMGLCEELLRRVEELYLDEGVARMKGSASSLGGLRTFLSLGHRPWGVGEDGSMKVDGPLAPWVAPGARPPEPVGVPPGAASVCPDGPPALGTLVDQMTDPAGLFRMTAEEARGQLCRLPF